jgi:hypothetical protein
MKRDWHFLREAFFDDIECLTLFFVPDLTPI